MVDCDELDGKLVFGSLGDAMAKAAMLRDEELSSMTEDELALLMAKLRDRTSAVGSPRGLSVHDETSNADAPPRHMGVGAAIALGATATLCIIVLLLLVLQAGDPCEKRLSGHHASLSEQLRTALRERDQLSWELQSALVERESLRAQIQINVQKKQQSHAGMGGESGISTSQLLGDSENLPFGHRLNIGAAFGADASDARTMEQERKFSGSDGQSGSRMVSTSACPEIGEMSCNHGSDRSQERLFDQLQAQVQSLAHDNNRLQVALHTQIAELWRLQGGQKIAERSNSFEQSLKACREDLRQAQQVQDRVRQLLGTSSP